MSDAAGATNAGAAGEKKGFFWDRREMQENKVNGKGGDILAFERGRMSRTEFQINFFVECLLAVSVDTENQ